MITIFTTGGTFDKVYFDANSEFTIGDTQVLPILSQASVNTEYCVEELLRKDSLNITDSDRQTISQSVVSCTSSQIIITHGTDTMTQTAQAIVAEGVANKTIVLVGAMQPARMQLSDASFNLGFALAAVQLLAAGVYIAMNGQVFPYDNVTKNRSAGCFQALR